MKEQAEHAWTKTLVWGSVMCKTTYKAVGFLGNRERGEWAQSCRGPDGFLSVSSQLGIASSNCRSPNDYCELSLRILWILFRILRILSLDSLRLFWILRILLPDSSDSPSGFRGFLGFWSKSYWHDFPVRCIHLDPWVIHSFWRGTPTLPTFWSTFRGSQSQNFRLRRLFPP